MSLTPEQKAEGWIEWNGGECPIKDDRTVHQVIFRRHGVSDWMERASDFRWEHVDNPADIIAYRIIEAHGADAEPARPTPYPAGYDDLVFDSDNWSQTIIVDGKRPEWLRYDDRCTRYDGGRGTAVAATFMGGIDALAIRVRRREPKRETVRCQLSLTDDGRFFHGQRDGTIDLIDGKPDPSTIKIAGGAL